ncbi:LuxR family transcriptional regulator [Arthrobacter sp. H35-D1]|uniref:helix-turn-helix transcriptional regulator n=1 Tax=Arthrobacter sp. H35-D1 TaxID=3046202 RepID=UPI0024BB9838|nr:LuxR family transcriptional regulator [Arthrobacter sp. H35-D1]MDJ0314602.1 AAA family ATPase [Arthrobacter sp. H35-D1]
MSQNVEAINPDLVGRATELAAVDAFLANVCAGTAGTLVVSGDPGVGKTALVQRACAALHSQAWVLAGACLPLASMTVPFLALRSAFRRAPTFDGVAYPTLRTAGEGLQDVPGLIDDWLEGLCVLRPVVLVIDDLQWVDQSTLDVLMYLIAGPPERRLGIIATLRSGEVGEGHLLQRWLADIRRLPRIHWMELGPLDRLGTGAQISNLLGAPPHQSLLQEIFTHTAGNPYLNRLLVSGIRPEARHLPPKLPLDLRAAVLRSWRSLSLEARQLTALMAVGGRPIRARDLATVAHPQRDQQSVLTLLKEAAEAGIAECGADGTHWWFHHPLIVEVLEQEQDADGRQRWHAAFAAHQQDQINAENTPDFESLVALADHHYSAGHIAEAYRWALCASTAAGDAGGVTEMLRLLRRAVELRHTVPEAQESELELWSMLRVAAEKTGALEVELTAVQELLARTDAGLQPLDVAELLVRRTHLLFSTGRSFMTVEDMRQALRHASADPSSWQYALALAELAHVELWKNDPEARSNATRALAIARAAGNPHALSYALTANVMGSVIEGNSPSDLAWGLEAMAAAAQARDFWGFVHATLWHANATETWSSQRFADLMRAGRHQLTELGAPHLYIAKLATDEAGSYLAIGRWRDCERALRVALGSDPGTMGDVGARLCAARLALWQGRQGEAQAHLARAEELYEHFSDFLNLDFDAIRAEVFLGGGFPEAAYAAAMNGATATSMKPTMCEWLVPLAARSLADQVQAAHDASAPTDTIMVLIDELVRRFPAVLREPGDCTAFYERQVAAFNLLYSAEVGRARESPSNATDWMRCADACGAATLLWEEAYCCCRAVESMLLHGHSQRDLAKSFLRRGLALTEELQAEPIRAQLLAFATQARINITVPATMTPSGIYAELPGLTQREREILHYVIAGRTYSEIARDLVISEKTVSSHISNLLRKTGAANRVDLSRLATQPASATPAPIPGLR